MPKNTKEISKQPLADQVDYWMGTLIVSIGRGRMRDSIIDMVSYYLREIGEAKNDNA